MTERSWHKFEHVKEGEKKEEERLFKALENVESNHD
jgi:hypothetical protein